MNILFVNRVPYVIVTAAYLVQANKKDSSAVGCADKELKSMAFLIWLVSRSAHLLRSYF